MRSSNEAARVHRGALVARQRGRWLRRRSKRQTLSKVGYVYAGQAGTDASGAGLRQGLADRGYEIGKNLALEERYADGDSEKIPELISELLARKVGARNCGHVREPRRTPRNLDRADCLRERGPVKTGLVASLNRPGGNVTGVSNLGTTTAPNGWN